MPACWQACSSGGRPGRSSPQSNMAARPDALPRPPTGRSDRAGGPSAPGRWPLAARPQPRVIRRAGQGRAPGGAPAPLFVAADAPPSRPGRPAGNGTGARHPDNLAAADRPAARRSSRRSGHSPGTTLPGPRRRAGGQARKAPCATGRSALRTSPACGTCPPPWSGCGSTASSPRPWPPGSTRCTWPKSSASASRPRSATRSTPGTCSGRPIRQPPRVPRNPRPAWENGPRPVVMTSVRVGY